MKLTYDPTYNIAYLQLKPKKEQVRTVSVGDEVNIDLAEDGSIYGIELLNANEQLSADHEMSITVENQLSGESEKVALAI
jgi:uncharacterized protein YuzE